MGLMDEMRRVSEQAASRLEHIRGEEATKHSLVMPFIQALGYNVFDPIDVVPEYTADFGTKQREKVDYAIMREGKPIILIEAKQAETSLSIWETSQIFRYYATTEARFGILTNGVKYQFYTDLEKRNIMDKQPFLIIDMLNLDDRLVNVLEGFTKANFDAGRILSSAKELKLTPEIRLKLAKEYQQPSRDLVKFFAKGLYSGSFKQSVFEEFAPIVRKAFHEFVDDKIASRPQDAIQPESSPAETEAQITVEERLIQPILEDGMGIPVFAEYGGHPFEAMLIKFDHRHPKTSRILYSNSVYSISKAAIVAINSVNPKRRAENGWDFWRLRDPYRNRERPIGDLRKDEGLRRRLLSQR